MNAELKKVVSRVKTAQAQLENLLKNRTWVEEARKYAERQGKEVKKLISGDVSKVKTFLEKERKELERFQKQIPGEVKKFRKFVMGQRKEIEKLLGSIARGKKKSGSTGRKKASKKGSGTSAGAES